MPRYKLRTLLIVLAIGPIVLATLWFAFFDPLIQTLTETRPIIKGDGNFRPGIGAIQTPNP